MFPYWVKFTSTNQCPTHIWLLGKPGHDDHDMLRYECAGVQREGHAGDTRGPFRHRRVGQGPDQQPRHQSDVPDTVGKLLRAVEWCINQGSKYTE